MLRVLRGFDGGLEVPIDRDRLVIGRRESRARPREGDEIDLGRLRLRPGAPVNAARG